AKRNPLTKKEARELLAYALYSARFAKRASSGKQRQLREARASGRASAVADYAERGSPEQKRARKVEAKLARRAGIGKIKPRKPKTNPALGESMERWARSKGLKVPGRGSAGWGALYTVWQRHGMPRANPKGKKKRPT